MYRRSVQYDSVAKRKSSTDRRTDNENHDDDKLLYDRILSTYFKRSTIVQ